jgi:hypothetical protein
MSPRFASSVTSQNSPFACFYSPVRGCQLTRTERRQLRGLAKSSARLIRLASNVGRWRRSGESVCAKFAHAHFGQPPGFLPATPRPVLLRTSEDNEWHSRCTSKGQGK